VRNQLAGPDRLARLHWRRTAGQAWPLSTCRARSSLGAWSSLPPSSRSAQPTSAASFPPRLAPSGWSAPA